MNRTHAHGSCMVYDCSSKIVESVLGGGMQLLQLRTSEIGYRYLYSRAFKNTITPYERWHSKRPKLSHIRCTAYAHIIIYQILNETNLPRRRKNYGLFFERLIHKPQSQCGRNRYSVKLNLNLRNLIDTASSTNEVCLHYNY